MYCESGDREVERDWGGRGTMERAVKASQGWHPSPICTCPQLLPWIDLLLSHCLPQIDLIDKTNIFFPPSVRSHTFAQQDHIGIYILRKFKMAKDKYVF